MPNSSTGLTKKRWLVFLALALILGLALYFALAHSHFVYDKFALRYGNGGTQWTILLNLALSDERLPGYLLTEVKEIAQNTDDRNLRLVCETVITKQDRMTSPTLDRGRGERE